MSPPRESAVFQLVRANHEQAEASHRRLRESWRGHDERLDELEKAHSVMALELQALKSAPPDLSRSTLSAGFVFTIVLAVAGIIGGFYGATWGMRSDIRDINTHLANQATHEQDAQRLLDERFRAMGTQIDGISKKQELQQIQNQELREMIIGRRPR